MTVELKAKRPFTDWVPGRGMVVFNEGDIDSLPTGMAERRVEDGFAERVEGKRKERAAPQPESPQPSQEAPRRGRPPKAAPATTDAPVD